MSDTMKIIFLVLLVLILVLFAWADEIHEAAQKGNLVSVRAIIDNNSEAVHSTDKEGRTPLHLASRGVHLEVIRYLVDKGADVNALDNNRVAPLHSLASRNHVEGIKFLLSKGADIDILDYERHTALHYAAMNNQLEAAALLVQKGAGLEIKDDYGRTPLLVCTRERGGPEMTRLLLEGGADVNTRNKALSTPLELAAWRGKTEVVDILLEAGAEIPTKGSKAGFHLMFAASKGLTNLFDKMDEKGVDLKIELSSGGTLMHEAAAGGALEIVNKLSAKGLDVNGKDRYGWAPIHYAAKNGNLEVVAWLLENKVDINSRTITGENPYNIAVLNKQMEVQKVLAAKGANTKPSQFPVLEGDYLGQKRPGEMPEIFALGIVSSIWGLHSTVVFSLDGTEALWAPMVDVPGSIYTKGIIFMMRKEGNKWTAPEPAPFSGVFDDDVPFCSLDGKRLFFISSRPLPEEKNSGKERIWFVDRTEKGFSNPKPLDPIINDQEKHWQFSLDRKGNIYFESGAAGGFGMGDVYISEYENGQYKKPVNLGPAINTDKMEGTPFISPDGSYLIFQRSLDLFISFREEDGNWMEARNMGSQINTPHYELCPIVTHDGKYLFFNSNRGGEIHTWWVEARIIDKLRSEMK